MPPILALICNPGGFENYIRRASALVIDSANQLTFTNMDRIRRKKHYSEIQLEQLKSSDIPAIYQLLRQLLTFLATKGFYSQQAITYHKLLYTKERLSGRILSPESIAYGAFSRRKLIGFLWAFQSEAGNTYLEWGGVADIARRKGVFSKLLNILEKEAAKRGSPKLWLYVSQSNIPALACYKRAGYSVEGVHPKHFFSSDFLTLGKIIARNVTSERRVSTKQRAA